MGSMDEDGANRDCEQEDAYILGEVDEDSKKTPFKPVGS